MRETEANAILRAVLEDPWDDAPRLVLADWMDVNDMPRRAELIRLGCELANMPCSRGTCHSIFATCDECVVRKSSQLNLVHHAIRDWDYIGVSPFSTKDHLDWIRRVRRGFLFRIAITLADFNRYAKDIFESIPVVDVQILDPPLSPPRPYGDPYRVDLSRIPTLISSGFTGYNYFSSFRTAQQALGRACVAAGRKLADLPLLPPKPRR